jgi:hypothetical protein
MPSIPFTSDQTIVRWLPPWGGIADVWSLVLYRKCEADIPKIRGGLVRNFVADRRFGWPQFPEPPHSPSLIRSWLVTAAPTFHWQPQPTKPILGGERGTRSFRRGAHVACRQFISVHLPLAPSGTKNANHPSSSSGSGPNVNPSLDLFAAAADRISNPVPSCLLTLHPLGALVRPHTRSLLFPSSPPPRRTRCRERGLGASGKTVQRRALARRPKAVPGRQAATWG